MRIANVLKSYYDELEEKYKEKKIKKADLHSRLFDVLIYDELILIGMSKEYKKQFGVPRKETGHREHLVPCKYIRDEAFKMFEEGKNVSDVSDMISKTLSIAYITKEEAERLDKSEFSYLKENMPEGWDFSKGSVWERLKVVNIEYELYEPTLD
jgi:hypothetical protein